MEKLIELVSIVNRNKIKSIEIIGKFYHEETLLNKFYNAIHDKLISNDSEAINYIYNNSKNKGAYYKLKFTLKNRLLNTLVLIDADQEVANPRSKAYLDCQKKVVSLNYLINTSYNRKNALWLSRKLLVEAMHWRYTEIVISTARFLRSYHASKSGNRELFLEYDKIVNDYLELYVAETKVESIYGDLLSHFILKKAAKKKLSNLVDLYIREIKKYKPKIASAKLLYLKAMIIVTKNMSVNDYKKTISICTETLVKLKALNYIDTKAIVVISYQLIACCIQLRSYNIGYNCLEYLFTIQKKGTFNWFKTNELNFNLSLHTANYSKAWEIFLNVKQNMNFNKLPLANLEIWRIYEAYLFFLSSIKITEEPFTKKSYKSSFKVTKFLNEVDLFSKDKKGLNIPILVVYILFQISRKKKSLLIDKSEAITRYNYRYLNTKTTTRSFIFINLLLSFPKYNFNKKVIIEKTNSKFKKLCKIPFSDQSYYIETIPYEVLWKMILNIIK